ncbi:MAG: Maf family protein [Balneolaceae bacterium]
MLKIVLASQSPRRKNLLTQLGLKFEVIPSNTEEIITSDNPVSIVEELSAQKSLEISKVVDYAYIIGADTIVVFENEILGKPVDKSDAFNMLSLLSNQTHSVFTGVSVVKKNDGKILAHHQFVVETKVTFSALTESEIDAYIETGSPMDKAGAYGIQDDWGAVFVKEVEGDFYNVVGFPLNKFYQEMKTLEPEFFNQSLNSISL